MCEEYLDLAEAHPCPISYMRGHLFKMLHHMFQIKTNHDLREVRMTYFHFIYFLCESVFTHWVHKLLNQFLLVFFGYPLSGR